MPYAIPVIAIMNALTQARSMQAHALPPEDRAILVGDFLASAQSDSVPGMDAAWHAEIKRRLEQISNGTAKLIAADTVHAQARRLYR